EVPTRYVEERATLDIRRPDQLADVPAAAALALDLFRCERIGLVREVAAEDDRVRPDVADHVRHRVRGHGALEGAATHIECALGGLREGVIRTLPSEAV